MDRKLRLYLSNNNAYAHYITAFEYNAQRMGGAPTITFTVYSFDTLEITSNSWVQFVDSNNVEQEERFFVRNTPSSSKSNTDARYKYDVTCISEREILDNVYFIDAVSSGNTLVSKSTEFLFNGTVKEYAEKINNALSLSNVKGYSVVVDSSVSTQDVANIDKYFTISNLTFTAALQEIYNQFDIPYYFVGKTIHVGYYNENLSTQTIAYGKDKALMEVKKTSSSNKIVTRCTGVGSSENIPSYYPNLSPTGEHKVTKYSGGITADNVRFVDYEKISKFTNLHDGAVITYHKKSPIADIASDFKVTYKPASKPKGYQGAFVDGTSYVIKGTKLDDSLRITVKSGGDYTVYDGSISFTFNAEKGVEVNINADIAFSSFVPNTKATYRQEVDQDKTKPNSVVLRGVGSNIYTSSEYSFDGKNLEFKPKYTGEHTITLAYDIVLKKPLSQPNDAEKHNKTYVNVTANFNPIINVQLTDYVTFDDSSKTHSIADSGITFYDPDAIPDNSSITISESLNWIEPQGKLMPKIYRDTYGVERFYNAINDYYPNPNEGDGSFYYFENIFDFNRFYEHIESFDDIKPSIKQAVNQSTKLRMDMFSAFDFDDNDNNDLNEKNELKHPYFYAKLRKLDFNLFDHAIEGGEMTVSFTSGDCAPCNFVIMVDENTKRNCLQVVDGKVKKYTYGENIGEAVFNSNWQKEQNDTQSYEVWVALRKEKDTYGEYRPSSNMLPEANEDTFVLTNIRMPQSYIEAAEKRLEDQIIEFMHQNNSTGFNFDIKYSRIFLQENPDYTNTINENARVNISYQGLEYLLYINSFKYKVASTDALPEISVTVSDSLQITKSGLSTLVSSVKSDVLAAVRNIDVMPTVARYAIRKDQDDSTPYNVAAKGLSTQEDIDVGGSAEIHSNVTVGNNVEAKGSARFQKGLSVGEASSVLGDIQGASISGEGDASFKSIRANYMEVFTMIYNQIKASSAYTVFDDTGTVIDLSLNDGVYTITFDDSEFNTKDASGVGVQPFVVGDILHGIVNNVNNYDYSQSGECWLRVTYTPTAANGLQSNQIKAVLFGDSDVPTAPNLAPTKSMVLAHKGNVDSVNHSDRQSTFYISSKDGNIVQLLDVSSPKLFKIEDGYSNYGIVLGKLPDDLFEYVQQAYSFVNKNHPYSYARGLVVQDLMRIDYLGRPIKDERARGEWSEANAVGDDPYRSYDATDVTYYDTVTYDGSLWQCFTDKTTEAPNKNRTAWTLLVEKGQSGTSVSIVNTEVKYATNNSGTESPTSGWQDNVPKVDDGSYLWTRTVVSYSDGKSTEAYSVSRIGVDGKGIQSSVITYAMKANTDVKPEDFNESDWGEFPTKLVDGYWLYTRTIVTYSDGEHATSYDVTQIGQGSYYAGLQEYYAKAQNDTTAPSDYPDTKDFVDGVATYSDGEKFTIGSAWTTSRPTLNSQEAYLWNFSISKDSRGNKYVTYPVCIGNFAKGIVSVVERYAISKYSEPNVANAKYPNDITSWTDEQNGAVPTEEKPYQWNYTLTTYNDGSKDEIYHVSSVKGMDSTSVQYDLQTNVNIIYIHDRENASTQSINLVVGKTSSKGYTEIDDSSELRNEGFIIQYAVDSHEPRYTLDFESTAMLLEGDEEIMLADENGRVLTYEFSVTDILSVEDHIMFYLVEVDSNGNAVKDWASREVDVVRDGGGAFTLELDTEKVVVNVDADNKIIDNSRTIQLVAQPKIGGKGVNVISVSAKDNASNTLVVNPIGAYGYKVEYRIEKGTIYNLPEFVEFTAKAFDLNNVEITASSKVVFMKSQQGITGPMGSKGASYFPQGNWNSGISYEYAYATDLQGNFILDEKGEKIVSGKPYVFYQKSGEANGYYYVLNTPKSTIGLNPSDAYNSNNKEWVWVENLKNVFAEILMAQWANLAKAVFEGDYMFSTKGVHIDGTFGDYSKNMFTNGRLNGNFVPNLFLDLNNGGAKFGKLSESFVTIANNVYRHDIQFNTCHNISRRFVADKACVVTLPKTKNKDQWIEDGSHCTIINEYDFDYTRYPTSANYDNSAVLVCADDLFFDVEHEVKANDFNEEAPTNGWFIWKNYRTKFLLLAPCSMLKLRSCKIEDDGIVWFVENSGEFEVLGTSITFSKNNQVSSEDEYTLTSHRLTDSESLDRNAVVVGSSVYNTYTQIVNGKRESKDTAWWFFKEGNQEGVYFERKD